ncbi:hypothetical protein VP01_6235g1, partial [Puccinia sorghi]
AGDNPPVGKPLASPRGGYRIITDTYRVCYSILFELPYFDPISNALVEPMHNIFSLPAKAESSTDSESGSVQGGPEGSDMSGSDVDPCGCKEGETVFEGQQNNTDCIDDLLSPLQNLHFPSDSDSESSQSDLSSYESDSSNNCHLIDCESPTEMNPVGAKLFSQERYLQTLQEVNREFTLPSWIVCVPSKIGSAKGGNLKADEWVILFKIIIIPTIILILSKNSRDIFQIDVFENLLHLHASQSLLTRDFTTIPIFFHGAKPSLCASPSGLPLTVGSAPQWKEWSFESFNDSLASIPTKNHIESRDLTLITRWVTAQNLFNLLPSLCQNLPAQVSKSLLKFMTPSKIVGQFSLAMKEAVEFLGCWARCWK